MHMTFTIGVTEGTPYPCSFCDKAFPRLSYLKRHEQVRARAHLSRLSLSRVRGEVLVSVPEDEVRDAFLASDLSLVARRSLSRSVESDSVALFVACAGVPCPLSSFLGAAPSGQVTRQSCLDSRNYLVDAGMPSVASNHLRQKR